VFGDRNLMCSCPDLDSYREDWFLRHFE
jgi:hypothetical protein